MMDQMTPPPVGKSKRKMPGQLAPPQTPKMPPPPMKPFQPLPQPSGGVYAQFNPTEQEVQRRMLPTPDMDRQGAAMQQRSMREAMLGAGVPEAQMGQVGQQLGQMGGQMGQMDQSRILDMIMGMLGGAGQAAMPDIVNQKAGPRKMGAGPLPGRSMEQPIDPNDPIQAIIQQFKRIRGGQ